MTIITVTTSENRLSQQQRRVLAESLTDAVLVPEVGQHAPAARMGFQVHFVERTPDRMAIGRRLLSDRSPMPDVATIDICVMDAARACALGYRVSMAPANAKVRAMFARECIRTPGPVYYCWGSDSQL